MAIWQFELQPIPAGAATRNGAHVTYLPTETWNSVSLNLTPENADC